ncbi:hypothetical protein VDGL01_09118, partial [Verticillium dahliae]
GIRAGNIRVITQPQPASREILSDLPHDPLCRHRLLRRSPVDVVLAFDIENARASVTAVDSSFQSHRRLFPRTVSQHLLPPSPTEPPNCCRALTYRYSRQSRPFGVAPSSLRSVLFDQSTE